MITRHEIKYENNQEVLCLYFDFNYEIASLDKEEKEYTLLQKILNYVKERKLIFNGTKILLIVDSIIIGSLLFFPKENSVDLVLPDNIITQVGRPNQISAQIEDKMILLTDKKPTVDNSTIIDKTIESSDSKVIDSQPSKPNTSKSTVPKNNTTNNSKPSTTTPKTNNTPTTTQPSTTTPTTPKDSKTPTDSSTTTPSNPTSVIPKEEPAKILDPVTIYRSNGTVITLEKEEYLVGVVSAEMPASFSMEALKAQAVAARTYTLKAISQGKRLTDTVSTQAYEDSNQLKAKWGNSYTTYYNKVKDAVNSTKGVYMTYNGKYIDAVYHSTNNGYTEDSFVVWGNNIPYLKTVSSPWDLSASSYLRTIYKDIENVSNILGVNINQDTVISTKTNDSNHIATVSIGDKTFTGIQLRNLLGLRSTDFDMTVNGGQVSFTTRGFGHAVGMSQYGANGMAKDGYSYAQILKHYYTGISIIS